jgi:hypothetical protein
LFGDISQTEKLKSKTITTPLQVVEEIIKIVADIYSKLAEAIS